MPKFRMRLQELDSHGGESALDGLNVRNDAEFLVPGLYLQQAEALALSNRFPQLKEPAIGVNGDGESLLLEGHFVLIFPRHA